MFGDFALVLSDTERPAHELLSNVLGAHAARRDDVVERSVHDVLVGTIREREAAWTR